MASKSAIWRATSNGAEGSNTSDRVEFNDFALTDSNMKVITQTTGILESAVAVNPKPKSAVDELQDTGFSSLTLSVVGSVKDPSDDGLDAAYLFKTWLLEDKTNASFPKGRFGLRLDDSPVFNVTPTSERGYIISNVQLIRSGETRGKLEFIATLRFNGKIGSANGSGQYIW